MPFQGSGISWKRELKEYNSQKRRGLIETLSSVQVTTEALMNSLEFWLPLQDLHNTEPQKMLSLMGVRLIKSYPSLRIYWPLVFDVEVASRSSSV